MRNLKPYDQPNIYTLRAPYDAPRRDRRWSNEEPLLPRIHHRQGWYTKVVLSYVIFAPHGIRSHEAAVETEGCNLNEPDTLHDNGLVQGQAGPLAALQTENCRAGRLNLPCARRPHGGVAAGPGLTGPLAPQNTNTVHSTGERKPDYAPRREKAPTHGRPRGSALLCAGPAVATKLRTRRRLHKIDARGGLS